MNKITFDRYWNLPSNHHYSLHYKEKEIRNFLAQIANPDWASKHCILDKSEKIIWPPNVHHRDYSKGYLSFAIYWILQNNAPMFQLNVRKGIHSERLDRLPHLTVTLENLGVPETSEERLHTYHCLFDKEKLEICGITTFCKNLFLHS